jgi:DNA-binding transcriptional ArsR family regulator
VKVAVDELSGVFQALAHEHRRRIVHALALRPHSISELADQRGVSLPAIHKHIRVLEAAGMVRRRKTGRVTFLALQRSPMRRLKTWVDQFDPEWGTDEESLHNYAGYLQNPQLKKESP